MTIILISLTIAYVICFFLVSELVIGNFQRKGRIGMMFHGGHGSSNSSGGGDTWHYGKALHYGDGHSALIEKLWSFKEANRNKDHQHHDSQPNHEEQQSLQAVPLEKEESSHTNNQRDQKRRTHQPLFGLKTANGAKEELHDEKGRRQIQLEIKEDKSNATNTFQWEWNFDRLQKVQNILQQTTSRPSLILTAYVEGSSSPSFAHINNASNGRIIAEPLRTQSPVSLLPFPYRQVVKCSDMPTKFPVSHPRELSSIYRNVHNTNPMYKVKMEYANYCPVDADPYLPWIHDVFPSAFRTKMGDTTTTNPYHVVQHIEFIAQNKRRCNTDAYRENDTDKSERFIGDLENLKPQVAIMQPVPIRRISNEEARKLAPKLWSHEQRQHQSSNISTSFYMEEEAEKHVPPLVDSRAGLSRYRLATYEDADHDSRETRFICRFHTLDVNEDDTTLRTVILGETLSVYPYNYEFANWHKDSDPMLKPGGLGSNNNFWNSVIHFRCPVPEHLQTIIGHNKSIINDAPTIYMDLIPIRTRVRLKGEEYFTEEMVGSEYLKGSTFDPMKEWGPSHVLPEVEASGRWANIPLCASPIPARSPNDVLSTSHQEASERHMPNDVVEGNYTKQTLIGCVWASAQFTTRGNSPVDSSTSSRLLEWLTFHLYVANMDHIYVYDNSGAHTDTGTLENITKLFPPSRVTRIDWPFPVCNNNIPAHWNTGERSSQYAAEASCRIRYGPYTEFLASFDTDEYLTPMGNWSDLKQWLTQGVSSDTNILSFFSSKASANYDFMQPYWDGDECGMNETDAKCVIQRPDALYVETYNCGKSTNLREAS